MNGFVKYAHLTHLVEVLSLQPDVHAGVMEFVDVNFKNFRGNFTSPFVSVSEKEVNFVWKLKKGVVDVGFSLDAPKTYSYCTFLSDDNGFGDDLSTNVALPPEVLDAFKLSDAVYLVFRVGVNDQGVYAVCTSHDEAVQAMKRAEALERDDYHDFEIRVYNINEDVKTDVASNSSRYITYHPETV